MGVAETDLIAKWTSKACFHAALLLLPLGCLTACTVTCRPWKPCAWGTAAHKNMWCRNSWSGRIIWGCMQTVFMELGTRKFPANLGAGEVFPATLQMIYTRACAAGQRIFFRQAWIIPPPPRIMPWTIQLVIPFVVKRVTHGSWGALILLEVKVVHY